MRILALGDVVGAAGVRYLTEGRRLSALRQSLGADLVIVNAENSAAGNGVTPESAEALFFAGADVLTGGNHSFRRREAQSLLDDEKCILRPANYPDRAIGHGYCITECAGQRVLVINLAGCVYMEPLESPFTCADRILRECDGKYDAAVIDIHAEATSEKIALARYLDGRVAAVFGTHTHVATADAQVLPGGTGYITDLGMCGSHAGILGVATAPILHKFLVKTPVMFTPAEGQNEIHGALFEIRDGKCFRAESILD
ncbi:MAG: YmdB family metallophosphoesterase [Clostridia bacterium]|nr:YmdB family metallophosphoesterase [Clostridia bacterium]